MLMILFCLKRKEKSGSIVFRSFIIYYPLAENLSAWEAVPKVSHYSCKRVHVDFFTGLKNANEQTCVNMRTDVLTGFSLTIYLIFFSALRKRKQWYVLLYPELQHFRHHKNKVSCSRVFHIWLRSIHRRCIVTPVSSFLTEQRGNTFFALQNVIPSVDEIQITVKRVLLVMLRILLWGRLFMSYWRYTPFTYLPGPKFPLTTKRTYYRKAAGLSATLLSHEVVARPYEYRYTLTFVILCELCSALYRVKR